MLTNNNIVLGTAQFGMDYGISNLSGQTNQKEVEKILEAASNKGVKYIDCAQSYGNAESIIGKAIQNTATDNQFKLITKISPDLDPNDLDEIEFSIIESKEKLNQESLWGVMLHREEWLNYWQNNGLKDRLLKLKKNGLVHHFGVSIYSTKYSDLICDEPELELIQIPHSIWHFQNDRVLFLEKLKNYRKQVFVRSIFIQGLLTMDAQKVQQTLPFAYDAIQKWEKLVIEMGIDKLEICLRYAKSLDEKIVVGVESLEQFDLNLELYNLPKLDTKLLNIIEDEMGPYINDRIINPSKW